MLVPLAPDTSAEERGPIAVDKLALEAAADRKVPEMGLHTE